MVLLGTRRCNLAQSNYILWYCCGVRKQGKNRAPEIGNTRAKKPFLSYLTIETSTTIRRRCIDASPSMAALVTGQLAHHDVVGRYARIAIE